MDVFLDGPPNRSPSRALRGLLRTFIKAGVLPKSRRLILRTHHREQEAARRRRQILAGTLNGPNIASHLEVVECSMLALLA